MYELGRFSIYLLVFCISSFTLVIFLLRLLPSLIDSERLAICSKLQTFQASPFSYQFHSHWPLLTKSTLSFSFLIHFFLYSISFLLSVIIFITSIFSVFWASYLFIDSDDHSFIYLCNHKYLLNETKQKALGHVV